MGWYLVLYRHGESCWPLTTNLPLCAGRPSLAKQAPPSGQLSNLSSSRHRLINVEEELRREQVELQSIVGQKQQIIDMQERRIQSLDAANARLLSALHQLKDRYQVH